jgi:hypothetical protein
LTELDRLLDYIRSVQAQNAPRELRIAPEARQPLGPAAVQAHVVAAYRLNADVKLLFGGCGECGSAWGPYADRHSKLLMLLEPEGQ